MNAEQWLEVYRQRGGFDDLVHIDKNGTVTTMLSSTLGYNWRFAEPAWRDEESPSGWFVLPPGWVWDEYDLAFWNEGLQLFVGQNLHDGKTVDLLDASGSYISKHITAPAAFRAALEYLKSITEDGTE